MKKIGIVLNNFGMSQLAYFALRQGEKFLESQTEYSLFGFYQNLMQPCTEPEFSLMHSFELFNFAGPLIATDLASAKQCLESFSASRRLFYVWDLEWIRRKINYGFYESLYCNPKLELIARSEEHAKLIRTCWNRNCSVVEDFNFADFVKIIEN